MPTLLNKHWHHLPEAEVTDLLDARPDTGLDQFDIKDRREKFGANTLTLKKGKGPLLEGLIMGTRCGDIDPSIPLYMQQQTNSCAKQVSDELNRHSGLLGISGLLDGVEK